MPGSFIDLKVIDLRVGWKIYLKYDKKTIKEINDLQKKENNFLP